MPYARFPLDLRADPRWQLIPATARSAAKALYTDAVLYSAELLTDGTITRPVLVGLAAENGVKRPTKVTAFLIQSGLLTATNTGFSITDWRQFHESREEVSARRKYEAERKRDRRAQLRLPDVPQGRPENVPPDKHRDSPARDRTPEAEAEAEAEAEESSSKGRPSASNPPRDNGLPINKELQITRLLQAIGDHADQGTATVVRSYAHELPEGTLAKVLESLEQTTARDRARYAVAALRDEVGHLHDPEPTL